VALVPPEGINMAENIILKLEVEIDEEDGIATLKCPAELRITERVASVLHQSVTAQGLKLQKWSISEDQQRDLQSLTNVVVNESEKIE